MYLVFGGIGAECACRWFSSVTAVEVQHTKRKQ